MSAVYDFPRMLQHSTASVLTVAVALALVVAGCGNSGDAAGQAEQRELRGQVVAVVSRDISEVETLLVRDDQGKVFAFTTRGYVGFSPSHLREHQLFGHPVVVTYIQEDDRLIAVRITD